MPRVIKFRGMAIHGSWFYGNLAIIPEKVDHIEAGSYISNSVGMPFAYRVLPETVGQFTGLHDRDGKEIYEGDRILQYPGRDYCLEYIIGWNEERCGFWMYLPEGNPHLDLGPHREGILVIGNIHENPDLLA